MYYNMYRQRAIYILLRVVGRSRGPPDASQTILDGFGQKSPKKLNKSGCIANTVRQRSIVNNNCTRNLGHVIQLSRLFGPNLSPFTFRCFISWRIGIGQLSSIVN